jgi:hypothetical protein
LAARVGLQYLIDVIRPVMGADKPRDGVRQPRSHRSVDVVLFARRMSVVAVAMDIVKVVDGRHRGILGSSEGLTS